MLDLEFFDRKQAKNQNVDITLTHWSLQTVLSSDFF